MHPSGLLIVGLLVAMGGVAWSAGGEDGWPVALRELIASERAFAQAADEGGIRAAFLSYLAPEAVVSGPGRCRGGRPTSRCPPTRRPCSPGVPSSRKRPRQETWATPPGRGV